MKPKTKPAKDPHITRLTNLLERIERRLLQVMKENPVTVSVDVLDAHCEAEVALQVLSKMSEERDA